MHLEDKTADTVILHVGVNDLLNDKANLMVIVKYRISMKR